MLRLFSVVLPQKKLMAPKTDVLWIGAIVCSTVVAILFSYEVAAGPCYRNSESVDSQTMRCSKGNELVPWGSCPSLPSAVSVPCGTLFVSQSIVIGTSGNEQTGFDNQELNEDACWKFYICQPVVTLGASRGPRQYLVLASSVLLSNRGRRDAIGRMERNACHWRKLHKSKVVT